MTSPSCTDGVLMLYAISWNKNGTLEWLCKMALTATADLYDEAPVEDGASA